MSLDPGTLGSGKRGMDGNCQQEEGYGEYCTKMLDENEFLSDYGIRSLSRYHRGPSICYVYVDGQEYRVDYLAAESNSGLFGGNSNLARLNLDAG